MLIDLSFILFTISVILIIIIIICKPMKSRMLTCNHPLPPDRYNERVEDHLRITGFYHASQIGIVQCQKALVMHALRMKPPKIGPEPAGSFIHSDCTGKAGSIIKSDCTGQAGSLRKTD
ncbi:hypothetical protein AHAS_Ahas12G0159600 [Arachis hypogaea]